MYEYSFLTSRHNVVKLKGRLLPLISQIDKRDNEWHAVYASRTANVYVNPATIPS